MRLRLKHFPHRYSWYIRRGYGVYAIRNDREAKALYDFCKKQVAEMVEDNLTDNQRMKVYRMTMELYQNNFNHVGDEAMELRCCDCGACDHFFAPYDIWDYANSHASWYWS